ncbi:MAG: carboxypeptidase-like regulatory domain-containing protein [Planctomycetota bacterium]
MPNLEDPSGDFDFVALNGNSFTTVPKVLTAASNIELNVPSSTLITIDGQSAANEIVQLSITPISGLDLPYPAFTGQAAAGYVAIGPFDASFDPIGVADGLTVTLPNTNQFPTGTTLSVYAYDDVLDGWVNRSQQTGEFASVQGDKIIAPGVVTRGGIYTAGGIVSDLCATTVQGRIFDVAGLAVADASIALSTGQKTLTDADGSFSIPLVPAVNYDALLSTPPLCVPEAISYRVTRSAQDGGDRSNIGLIPSPISGGTTNLGDIVVNEFAPVSTASVVGILTGSEAEPAVLVDLLGPSGSDQSIEAASSQFFRLGLEPGFYTASTEFEFSTAPTLHPPLRRPALRPAMSVSSLCRLIVALEPDSSTSSLASRTARPRPLWTDSVACKCSCSAPTRRPAKASFE